MNWEKLTSPAFKKAVDDTGGVCLLPIGVIEKHGDHLPLGQDILYIHRVSTLAAEMEPAMVFPPYYFGQILEAKHVPGTIAISGKLQLELLEAVCDEIGRNGFKKILIVNGHGGNNHLLPFFCQLTLDRRKDYLVFLSGFPEMDSSVTNMLEAKLDGHAGEAETCSMMHLYPDLAEPEQFGDYGAPLRRMQKYQEAGIYSGINWYADQPGHLQAEKVPFTAEKGRILVDAHTGYITRQIRVLKSDDTPMELYQEFHERSREPENRYP